MLTFVALAALCGLPVWGGRVLDRRYPRAVPATAAVATALLLIRTLLARRPDVALAFFPYAWYVRVELWWAAPVTAFLFGATFCRLTRPWLKRTVVAVGSLVGILCLAAAWFTAMVRPEALTGVPGPDHLCLQTSQYSCGAAAGASAASLLGVPATEREVAEVAGTNGLWGTTPTALAVGLRARTARRWQCGVGDADWALGLPRPCIVTLSHNALVDHWVALAGVPGAGGIAYDPLDGKRALSEPEFRARFRGFAVWAED